ncbi:MAG: hypothetical protein Q8O56_15120 [Solirubrobacteraceae bacterium]|nr:hypothetical protein [Solirubrobacteraceae bacterium]
MAPLLNADAIIRCGHGGTFTIVPSGPRPLLGGAPALNARDLAGATAVGCTFNAAGAPAPCVIASVIAGTCPAIVLGGAPAIDQTLVCATSSGVPTIPVSSAGQTTVQGG